MDRFQRILGLHRLLQGRKTPIARRDIETHLECSRATARRIIEELRDIAGAPIIYDRAAGGYRYDPAAPAFELPGLWFNPSELQALIASLEFLSSVQPGLFTHDIKATAQRIRRLLQHSGHTAHALSHAVVLQQFRSRPVDLKVFAAILEGILRHRQVCIHHRHLGDAQASARIIHPWRLVHYRDVWYVLAWCPNAKDTRRFALDRIPQATILAEGAAPPDTARIDQLLSQSFGIFHGEPTATAELVFSGYAAHLVATEIWHPQQHGTWQDGVYHLKVPYADPRELILEVLRHIPHAQVLGPPELAEEFASRVRTAAAMLEARPKKSSKKT